MHISARLYCVLATLLAASCLCSSASAQAIIQTEFASADAQQPIHGTQLGLKSNLPGGRWTWGSGWAWGTPVMSAKWEADANRVYLGEERTSLGISIASAGDYTKPQQFHVKGTFTVTDSGHPDGRNGFGFWSKMPGTPPAPNSGAAFGGGEFAGFTGIVVGLDGVLRLYEKGTPAKTVVETTLLAAGSPFEMSFDVDTRSGAISNLVFGGTPIAGLSSTAFTDDATNYVGFATGSGSRGGFDELVVSPLARPKSTTAPAAAKPAVPPGNARP